jgi:DNA-directed RNA polymerase specialized sigma24 family protein
MLEPSQLPENLIEKLNRFKTYSKRKIEQMGLQAHLGEEDVLQEIAISILKRQSTQEIENENAYIRTCILHHLLKIKKIKEKELRKSQPVESLPQEDQIPQEGDSKVKIQYLLTQLLDLDRKIIEYAFFEELKAPEIAERLNTEGHNLTPANVRQRKKRAIDRLRQIY